MRTRCNPRPRCSRPRMESTSLQTNRDRQIESLRVRCLAALLSPNRPASWASWTSCSQTAWMTSLLRWAFRGRPRFRYRAICLQNRPECRPKSPLQLKGFPRLKLSRKKSRANKRSRVTLRRQHSIQTLPQSQLLPPRIELALQQIYIPGMAKTSQRRCLPKKKFKLKQPLRIRK